MSASSLFMRCWSQGESFHEYSLGGSLSSPDAYLKMQIKPIYAALISLFRTTDCSPLAACISEAGDEWEVMHRFDG